jgi:hypothetical protein
VGDRELETLIGRAPALRRRPRPNGDRSAAGSLLRLQGLVGNSAVAALVQRTPTGSSPTPVSIGEALSKVKLTTAKKTVKQLEPWEIYRLVTANTPKKKALYKELRAAWTALEAAKKKLTAADEALAKSKAAAAPAPAPALARKTKTKSKTKTKAKPVDPAAVRTAVADAVDKAQKRVDKAIEAIKDFILADNDLLRKVRNDERSLKKSLTRAKAALATLKKRKKPDAAKVKESEEAVTSREKELAAIPKRRQDAIDQTKEHIKNTSFGPEDVQRTIYNFEIEGETVTLSDRVDSWATKFENGLVEADRAVQTKLDDVLAGTTLSESNKKILRAISDNESGGAPWSSVNTYDRAVLTWGLVQWTGGKQSDLTAALTTIKTVAPDAFAARFEKYGIDVVNDELVITGADGSTKKGDDAAMGILQSPTLSAVMSRAGLDSKIQQAEVAAAAQEQITGPLAATFAVDGTKLRYSQVLTSEFAVGLFADQVVNSGKGGTQQRVANAVRAHVKSKKLDAKKVTEWQADLEKTLITLLSPFANRVTPFTKRGCSKTAGSYTP